MGVLHYNDRVFEFEDRVLAHVQIVVGLKLRRSEPFYLSWVPGPGAGRQSIWIGTGIPLHFEFSGSRTPALNREWIEALLTASNSSSGLNISEARVKEPTATA